jgi:hypothetical protein
MSHEVPDTVKLYLAGKIDQWYVRKDGKGVVFFLNLGSTEEAKIAPSRASARPSKVNELRPDPPGSIEPAGSSLAEQIALVLLC